MVNSSPYFESVTVGVGNPAITPRLVLIISIKKISVFFEVEEALAFWVASSK